MKQTLALLIAMCVVLVSLAQTNQFEKGQIDIQAGIGVIPTFNSLLDQAGVGSVAEYTYDAPLLSATVDYAISDELSLGGYYGTAKSTLFLYGTQAEKDDYTIIGVRGMYHLDLSPKFDLYAGAMAGIISVKATMPAYFGSQSNVENSYGFIYHAMVGARFRFVKNVGVFAEIGYGLSIGNAGLNVKF
jgi:hypothetical protein